MSTAQPSAAFVWRCFVDWCRPPLGNKTSRNVILVSRHPQITRQLKVLEAKTSNYNFFRIKTHATVPKTDKKGPYNSKYYTKIPLKNLELLAYITVSFKTWGEKSERNSNSLLKKKKKIEWEWPRFFQQAFLFDVFPLEELRMHRWRTIC